MLDCDNILCQTCKTDIYTCTKCFENRDLPLCTCPDNTQTDSVTLLCDGKIILFNKLAEIN